MDRRNTGGFLHSAGENAAREVGYSVIYTADKFSNVGEAAVQEVGSSVRYTADKFSNVGEAAVQEMGYSVRYTADKFSNVGEAAVQEMGYSARYAAENFGPQIGRYLLHGTTNALYEKPLVQLLMASLSFYLLAKGVGHIVSFLGHPSSHSIIYFIEYTYFNRYLLLFLALAAAILIQAVFQKNPLSLRPFICIFAIFDAFWLVRTVYFVIVHQTNIYDLLLMTVTAGLTLFICHINEMSNGVSTLLGLFAMCCADLLVKLSYISLPYLLIAIDFGESLYINRYTLLILALSISPVVGYLLAKYTSNSTSDWVLLFGIPPLLIFSCYVLIKTFYFIVSYQTHYDHLAFFIGLTVIFLGWVGWFGMMPNDNVITVVLICLSGGTCLGDLLIGLDILMRSYLSFTWSMVVAVYGVALVVCLALFLGIRKIHRHKLNNEKLRRWRKCM